ncbi:MAG: hypothetical protein AVDCRST_MAG67-2230 [uncultured Solirubrobacteraceae bacterium]|uniref:Uncharacterized protein n=1 Tax=uncultured Solirubrobacteraceae bacterium TaxID=1162706 RepID=A0A6J4SSX5_9ACTN|nr:MAG: hypothetical protein AVDCRST_MAG67-2230 [uncultured Solirubrobacteraceae bacterium]
MDECSPDELAALRERVRVLAAGGVDHTFEISADARRHAQAGETALAVRELGRHTPGG